MKDPALGACSARFDSDVHVVPTCQCVCRSIYPLNQRAPASTNLLAELYRGREGGRAQDGRWAGQQRAEGRGWSSASRSSCSLIRGSCRALRPLIAASSPRTSCSGPPPLPTRYAARQPPAPPALLQSFPSFPFPNRKSNSLLATRKAVFLFPRERKKDLNTFFFKAYHTTAITMNAAVSSPAHGLERGPNLLGCVVAIQTQFG